MIFVPESNEFISSNFVLDRLAQSDEPVVCLDKLTYAVNLQSLALLRSNAAHVFSQGGIGDSPLIARLPAEHKPRAVVNCAAESHVNRSTTGPENLVQTDVLGIFRPLEAVRSFWSALPADEVYGSLSATAPAFTDDHLYKRNSQYSASKAEHYGLVTFANAVKSSPHSDLETTSFNQAYLDLNQIYADHAARLPLAGHRHARVLAQSRSVHRYAGVPPRPEDRPARRRYRSKAVAKASCTAPAELLRQVPELPTGQGSARTKATPTKIPDMLLIEPKVVGNARGFFYESFNRKASDEAVERNADFVQDNHLRSSLGVLRGLHYQTQKTRGKLVRVRCTVFDVAVDARKFLQTLGRWVGVEFSEENNKQLLVPPGFAQGYVMLSEKVDFRYKTTCYYAPWFEHSILWNDQAIRIACPDFGVESIFFAKDATGQKLNMAKGFS